MMNYRISNMRITNNYTQQLQNIYGDYMKSFEQSDGSKLHRASDGVVEYSRYLRYQNSITGNEQFQEDVNTALSWMTNSDASLTKVVDNLREFNRKVIDSANSTNIESDLKDIAKELFARVQAMVQDMNIQVGDRYLFSGQSDTVQPFKIADEKIDRGMTKTLDDLERNYFTNATPTGSVTQFLVLNGDDGEVYYLNNTDGMVYTKEFVDDGYKTRITAGFANVQSGDEAAQIDVLKLSDYFEPNGEIKANGRTWTKDITVAGKTVNLTFDTINQYVVEYNGDDKYISMVNKQGMTQPQSDTVNATGQDIFGSDIFDFAEEHQTGTAMLNELLTVIAQVDNGKYHWASSDAPTLSYTAVETVLGAQTKIAARNQAYQATQVMLINQNESIMSDITDVSSTDVGKLATMLMQQQTVYSLSMSVGSRILPGSLADYL